MHDSFWHRQETHRAGPAKPGGAFQRAFHFGQLALHDPLDAGYWPQLSRASQEAGNFELPLTVANRVLESAPELAPVYFERARARARFGQFAEDTADQLMGLILASRPAK
jgi:hypothetical protein